MNKENEIKVNGNTIEIGDKTKISINEFVNEDNDKVSTSSLILVAMFIIPLFVCACIFVYHIVSIIGIFDSILFFLCAKGIIETVKALLP